MSVSIYKYETDFKDRERERKRENKRENKYVSLSNKA